jgi:hypothetical protein
MTIQEIQTAIAELPHSEFWQLYRVWMNSKTSAGMKKSPAMQRQVGSTKLSREANKISRQG